MLVATMQLVTQLLIFVVNRSTQQLIRVIFKGDRAVIADHWVPFWDDTSILSALIMGDGAVIVGVVDVEAPMTVLPQGAIPFSVVGLFITAFEAVGEGGALALVTLVFGDSV